MKAHFERLIEVYTLDNYPLLAASGMTFFLGFWQYILAFRQTRRTSISPLPFWMHIFYLAHDSTWAVRSLIAASEHEWHWFLTGNAVALSAWTCLEIVTIHNCVFNATHRQDIWGPQRPGQKTVSTGDALWQAAIHLAGFYALLNFLIDRFADEIEMLDWYILTNVVLAWGPSELWASRPSREYNTVLYATSILLTTLNSFGPWNMWQFAAPDVYDTFWYKALGAAVLVINLDNFRRLLTKPSTEAQLRGKKSR